MAGLVPASPGDDAMTADVNDCAACGVDHHNLHVYRGHQGRGHYVFCPYTGKAVDVVTPPVPSL